MTWTYVKAGEGVSHGGEPALDSSETFEEYVHREESWPPPEVSAPIKDRPAKMRKDTSWIRPILRSQAASEPRPRHKPTMYTSPTTPYWTHAIVNALGESVFSSR